MSASASIQEPARLPNLPPEIVLQILGEVTQKKQCWINLITKGESPCGEHDGAYDTLVYTGGAQDQDAFTTIYARHECIFTHPVADGKVDPGQSCDKSWELSLQANRLKNQLNVYERSVDPDLVSNLRSLCLLINEEDIDFEELRLMCQRLFVLNRDITEVLPFTDDVYGGPDAVRPLEPDSGARKKRMFPSDDMLECQRLRHVMIHTWPWKGPSYDLVDEAFYRASPFEDSFQDSLVQSYFQRILPERMLEDDMIILDVDWSLLSGLESLCLDLNTVKWFKPIWVLRPLFLSMSKHLKLKTLVVCGPSSRGIHPNSEFMPMLPQCLQPGGKLHLLRRGD
ncbi:hypothetical protein FLONG3_9291 [Fusarium longipes]|uniref:Uncharacterized protein n=1 Tax=Fusarium longipes TaxID=694270 RepID=A0A395RZ49_9HYPO|nr:hypothetical protein FLONG3_9291 [Fusarium longipes]